MKTVWVDAAEDFTVTTFPAADCDAATGTRRIAAAGRLTRLGGELLEAAVTGLFTGIPANMPRRVWVDLTEVTGADPAGLAWIVDARRVALRHSADLTIDTGHGAAGDVAAFHH